MGMNALAMSDAASAQRRAEAALPAARRKGRPLLAIGLSALTGAAVIAATWYYRNTIPLWPLIAGTGLAFIGLASFFGLLAGLLRLDRGVEERAFLDGIADAAGGAWVVTDMRGAPIYANTAYRRLAADSGHTRLIGVEHLYSGYSDIADHIYRLAQAAREGRPAQEELRLNSGSSAAARKAERPVWIRVSVAPFTMNGKTYSLWRHEDISADRVRQEGAFAHLQYIINYLDQAPAGFFSAEADGKIAYVNATLADWLGLSLEQTTGGQMTLKDIVSETGEKLLLGISPKRDEVRTETFDIELATKNGNVMPVRIIHRTDYDSEGRLQPSRSLVLRRTVKGRAEKGFSAADARLSRFFNSVPVGIAEVDGAGFIRNANPAFVSLSPKAQRGAPLTGIVIEAQRSVVTDALLAARSSEGRLFYADVTVLAEHPRSVQLVISHLITSDDGFFVYALDTTESKTLEVQLAQSQKMQAIGQLAGGVAHDFNNVLTAIIGFSDLLLAKHRPTDPAFADIMNIKQNANRAANLVRQLLAFSRRQTMRSEVLSLTDILSDLGNLLGRLLGEKIELKILHGRDLWLVKVDVNQFEQVIINLAVNARDAMPKGGILTIRTANVPQEESRTLNPSLMPPGEYVMCEVVDTGTGIPKEILDKIWEPFFSTKEVGKGTGLGLSTVYGIIKQTGGFIFCDSELGRSTSFRIYLPRHHASERAEPEPREEKRDVKRADLTGKGTILLIEDEDAVRTFASRALASRGYTVLEANSGERALEIAREREGKFDLVISDVVMPEMDGPTLLKELRRRGITAKIIFISGYAEDAFEKNLEGEQDFHFLPKPFSLKQLAEAVKDVMER
jgi:two-component system cell cycle sensor histidine kinase/response regulator CckA